MDDDELAESPRARPRRLVRGARAGTRDRCYSIALRVLGNPHDAEEVAQDALVRAYRAIGGYHPERVRALRLRPWLATIVVNLCRNRTRRARAGVRRRWTPSSRSASSRPPRRRTSRPNVAGARRRSRAPRGAAGDASRPLPRAGGAAPRRRPVLRGAGRGPRPARGHTQGPGLPGPRDAPCRRRDRARGADRMNPTPPIARRRRARRPRDARGPGAGARGRGRPRRGRPRRPDGADRLAARARCGSRGTGAACPRWSRRRTAPRPPPATQARGPAGRRRSSRPCPRRWPMPIARRLAGRAAGPDPAGPPRPHRVRGRGLDEGARDPARRGPAVRLDRRRDRPAEGGAGGRDGARPQPGAADRALPPRRADGRDDRPVQPRRARQQADGPRGRGAGPRRRMEAAARGGERLSGSTTTQIVCWPTCRHARRVQDRYRVSFRSLREARAQGLPAVQDLPPGGGRRGRLIAALRPQRRASRDLA